MVEATGINIPSGDFAFSIIGRWPRAREGARARVRNIEIGELSIGEALEAVGVVARVKVLPGNCSHEVDAEGAVPWKVPGGGTCGARLRIVERGEGAVRVGHKAVEHEVRV